MNEETVTFTKPHIYGGRPFEAGDKLICPSKMADHLRKIGAVEAKKPKKKEKSDG